MNSSLYVELSKEKYNRVCEKEYICIYDQPWFMDVTCGGEDNWEVLVCSKGEEVVGALPFYVKSKMSLKYISLPYRVQHNGIWIKPYKNQDYTKRISFENEVMTALIESMEKIIKERKYVFYNQSISPDITNWLPFYWNGFMQTTMYTYRINDIMNLERVYNDFHSNKKKQIKKASKSEIIIKSDLSAMEFYTFHKRCLEEEGKKIHYSYEEFLRLYDALYLHDAGKLLYAVDEDDNVIDAIFSAIDARWGYNWWHAISKQGRGTGIPDLMVYEMIKYLSQKGIRGYDMEGSMIQGVEESFRHYGAVQTPYFSVSKVYARNAIIKLLLNAHFAK